MLPWGLGGAPLQGKASGCGFRFPVLEVVRCAEVLDSGQVGRSGVS